MSNQVTAQEVLWRSTSEQEVQDALLDALRANWWAYSHHPDSRRVKGPGIPDLVAIRPGEVLFLECKRERRARWYPRQRLWKFGLECTPGVEYWVVKPSTLDGVIARLRQPLRGGEVVQAAWEEQLRGIEEQEAVAAVRRGRRGA